MKIETERQGDTGEHCFYVRAVLAYREKKELLKSERKKEILLYRGKKTHIIPLRAAVFLCCVHCGNIPDSSVLSRVQLLREKNSLRKKRGLGEGGLKEAERQRKTKTVRKRGGKTKRQMRGETKRKVD